MTKRDFERMAKALRFIRVIIDRDAGHDFEPTLFEDIVDQIALACAERADGVFDYSRFRDACYRQ